MRAASGLLAATMLLACGSSRTDDAPRNLLLITVDTLRADRLGVYGYEKQTSPRIDAFARESVVFDDAQTQTSWTLGSLASLMTSVEPWTHGAVDHESTLDRSFTTMAEELSAAGFDTAGIVNHVFLAHRYGLDQGFGHYDEELVQELEPSHLAVTSERVTEKAQDWLEQRRRGAAASRWFLWVHYFDPHHVYQPHEGFSERFGRSTRSQLYDGEIAYTDDAIGRLLDTLGALGFADDTVVALVADHGEEFRDHGHLTHGRTLHREVLHVPLVIRVPGLPPRRVHSTVAMVDLRPSLLEVLGIEGVANEAGRSFVPAMRGRAHESSVVAAQVAVFEGFHAESIQHGRWKLMVDLSGATLHPARGRDETRVVRAQRVGGMPVLLFDTRADPSERTNLAAAHPDIVAELRRELDETKRRALAARGRYEVSKPLQLGPQALDELRALGYVD